MIVICLELNTFFCNDLFSIPSRKKTNKNNSPLHAKFCTTKKAAVELTSSPGLHHDPWRRRSKS